MPGPKTHHIFYKELKTLLNKSIIEKTPNYDKYSIFAQGHDFLIYHDFYKILNRKRLEKNLSHAEKLQEFSFAVFVYNYIKNAINIKGTQSEQIILFILGYISHHILDAYTHPFIIYYSGDHVRTPQNSTWNHGIMENFIDIYMMVTKEHLCQKTHKVHKDFAFKNIKIETEFKIVLSRSLQETYNIKNGDKTLCKAFFQLEHFMHIFKYDRFGIKQIFFDKLDPFFKGTSSFSYHRDINDAEKFLNKEHDIWHNPMFENKISNESFMDLYNKALIHTAKIINTLEESFKKNVLLKEDIFSIVPNISSTHGFECGKNIEINCKKQWD